MEKHVLKKATSQASKPSAYQYLNAMDDFVRVVNEKGEIVYENEALERFNLAEGRGEPVFPVSTATGMFIEQAVTMTELCVAGHVFAIKNSPIVEEGRVTAVIQVFRDTTIQNSITVKLLDANRKMKNQIALARTLQEKMLPRLTGYGRLQFDARYQPTEELSGDFFDFVPLGQGRIGLYISDVVGHGVSASILTMFVRQSMRSILTEEKIREPANVLARLRERYRAIHIDDGFYFSLFYIVFDTMEHKIHYANAGHNGIPIVVSEGELDHLEATGRLVTWDADDYQYKQYTRPLRPGDRFLFYTDGAIEGVNAYGQEYGIEGLERFLLHGEGSPIDHIMEDLRQFVVGEQKDDVAIVYVENQGRMG